MIREEQPESITVKRYTYICDSCGKDSKDNRFLRICYICGRQICRDCTNWFEADSNLLSPNWHSDYPDSVCDECWDRGKTFREQIQTIRDKSDQEEIDLWSAWKKERSQIANVQKL